MATVVKNMIHFLRGVGWLSEDFWQRWSPMCLFPRPGGMLVVSVLPGLVDEYITENTYYYHSFPLLPFSSFSTTSAIMFPEPWVGRWYKGLLLDNSISLFNVITPQSFLKVLAPNWLNCTFICLLLFWTTQKCFMLDPNCWVSYLTPIDLFHNNSHIHLKGDHVFYTYSTTTSLPPFLFLEHLP